MLQLVINHNPNAFKEEDLSGMKDAVERANNRLIALKSSGAEMHNKKEIRNKEIFINACQTLINHYEGKYLEENDGK